MPESPPNAPRAPPRAMLAAAAPVPRRPRRGRLCKLGVAAALSLAAGRAPSFASGPVGCRGPTCFDVRSGGRPPRGQVGRRLGLGGGDPSQPSIQTMLARFGLPALGFHFSVWVASLVAVYSALSFAGDDASLVRGMPEFLQDRLGSEGGEAASGAGRAAATLAVVEVIGPARLALTVAVAPTAAENARKYEWFRSVEDAILEKGREAMSRLGVLSGGAR